MLKPVSGFVVPPGAGTRLRAPVGGPVLIKAGTETTGGTFALLEVTWPPLEGPPLHVHAREDEMWWVLEGDWRFRMNDQLHHVRAGSFAFVPRGVTHSFQNVGETAARILVMFTPSGMDRFFEQQAELAPGRDDPEAYDAIAQNNWMRVTGPPLAEADSR
jgi:mannose-6-phosphate isomerase-like protein (cupin superfamily)